MKNDDIIELHFIDGPLAGTRKREHKDVLQYRTYRHLEPNHSFNEISVPVKTSDIPFKQITCSEWQYVFVSLPPSYEQRRFAMVLERGI